jgi:hypothetical protein
VSKLQALHGGCSNIACVFDNNRPAEASPFTNAGAFDAAAILFA